MGGLSVWRGKFTDTTGKVVYDKEAKSGTIDVNVSIASIDFGMAKMDEHAKSPDIFDAAKYPTATYSGKFTKFNGSAPTEAEGTLTLHGVTKPLTLKIDSFLCKPNPMTKKEVCGADATASFDRSAFGINYGDSYGFPGPAWTAATATSKPARIWPAECINTLRRWSRAPPSHAVCRDCKTLAHSVHRSKR